jgi:hypothetical protein
MKVKDAWKYKSLLKSNTDSIDNYLGEVCGDEVMVFIPKDKSNYNADITIKMPLSNIKKEYNPSEWNYLTDLDPPSIGKYTVLFSDNTEAVLEYVSELDGDPGTHWFYHHFKNPYSKKIVAFKDYVPYKRLKKEIVDMVYLLTNRKIDYKEVVKNVEELYNDKTIKDVKVHLNKDETMSGISLTLRFSDNHFYTK